MSNIIAVKRYRWKYPSFLDQDAAAAAAASAHNDKSPLFQLPGEIKNRIYYFAGFGNNIIHLQPGSAGCRPPKCVLTCQKLHEEVKSIHYESNTFCLSNISLTPAFIRQLKERAGISAGKITRVRVIKLQRFNEGTCWLKFSVTSSPAELSIEVISNKISGLVKESHNKSGPCYCGMIGVAARVRESGTSTPLLDFLEEYSRQVLSPPGMMFRATEVCEPCGLVRGKAMRKPQGQQK